jgi:hypothetical protein
MRVKVWIGSCLILILSFGGTTLLAQELIDAVHVPILDVQPLGPTMRDPLHPDSSDTVDMYLGITPAGAVQSGVLHYRFDGGAWQMVPLGFSSTFEDTDYWVGSVALPAGGFTEYYLDVSGSGYLQTYIYGTDTESFTTGEESVAQSNPYGFTIGITPTPTPTVTPTPPMSPTAAPTGTNTAMPPTQTPMPPTNTPMPPTDTPAAPSSTPGPSTATPEPTDTPPPSTTPGSPTPTHPAPPTSTPAVTATPTPALPYEVDLVLNHDVFNGGEQFTLMHLLWNRTEMPVDTSICIVLEVYGFYWFWPSWSTALDYEEQTLNPTSTTPATYVILDFPWKEESGAGFASFLSAMLSPDLTEILSNMDTASFSWY